ncbi:ionic transporter y4hA [Hydrogenophaga sp. 5NK40-0174]|uniref:calcium:proton antiporter n=1 Tax=Hydrogenophaga sp. 5NK40-0174 TaxID=3127649 RepID=UPI0031089365
MPFKISPYHILPWLCAAVLAAGLMLPMSGVLLGVSLVALIAAVGVGVHHAEVIAHRVGEPYGTLVLALSVTIIEAALIISMMIVGGEKSASVARDAIYGAVMVIVTGVVGLCLLVGGWHHREQTFRLEGTNAGMAALAVMAGLVLVMPSLTISAPGARYSGSQLAFVALGSLALWLAFIFFQTVRHREFFLPEEGAGDQAHAEGESPTTRSALVSFGLLVVALVSVVGLAKLMSPSLEALVSNWALPQTVVGVVIAVIVLLPESYAAVRAARANRLQTSMNLAIGSALACIGLTVPVVVVAALWLDLPLNLGLASKDIGMLTLTFVMSAFTLGAGRTNFMQGAVHVVMFAAFLFLTLEP